MCTRDLVARGKRSAPADASHSGAGVGSCRQYCLGATGRRPDAFRAGLPLQVPRTLAELAFSLPRATGALTRFRWRDYVPRPCA